MLRDDAFRNQRAIHLKAREGIRKRIMGAFDFLACVVAIGFGKGGPFVVAVFARKLQHVGRGLLGTYERLAFHSVRFVPEPMKSGQHDRLIEADVVGDDGVSLHAKLVEE